MARARIGPALWWSLAASLALFAFAGCTGGHARQRPPAVVAPAPTAPSVRSHVPCLSYVYAAMAADFAAMQAAGIGAVLDYDQVGICDRARDYAGGLVAP